MPVKSAAAPAKSALVKRQRNLKSPKNWIKPQQTWTWAVTIVWMEIANLWAPFGLYGFVCMLVPIILAFSGWGKMTCVRLCPRGSFSGCDGKDGTLFYGDGNGAGISDRGRLPAAELLYRLPDGHDLRQYRQMGEQERPSAAITGGISRSQRRPAAAI